MVLVLGILPALYGVIGFVFRFEGWEMSTGS